MVVIQSRLLLCFKLPPVCLVLVCKEKPSPALGAGLDGMKPHTKELRAGGGSWAALLPQQPQPRVGTAAPLGTPLHTLLLARTRNPSQAALGGHSAHQLTF